MKVLLTIAGSDPTAGAGLQADLRVFNHLGLYGECAVTAVTSQNTEGVQDVFPVSWEQLASQLEALLADGKPAVTKTGMLASNMNLNVVKELAASGRLGPLVVDPVLGATAGKALAEEGLAGEIAGSLLPLTTLVTPNLAEAAALTGLEVATEAQAAQAARALVEMGAGAACVTGGHLPGEAVDVLFDGDQLRTMRGARVGATEAFHGTGCLFSAAAAGYLALGMNIAAAVEAAKELSAAFIAAAVRPGRGMSIPWPPA